MIKVCAFMSLFNEEDIIKETIEKLISNGIDIYIIDNGCTDKTIQIAENYLGKGVITIKEFVTIENGKKVFRLSEILEQFEIASKALDYDWFLISDADEIKYSPWAKLSLTEGINKVDLMGYNLINFKLFDFHLLEGFQKTGAYEICMEHYSEPHKASYIQMKCWKKTEYVDIKSYGGHIISVPNPKLFPVRFINKHYPIRSIEHGVKKLKKERFDRYSPTELKQGWHRHYSHIDINDANSIVKNKDDLIKFEMSFERANLFEEALDLHSSNLILSSEINDETRSSLISNYLERNGIHSKEHIANLFTVAKNLHALSTSYEVPKLKTSSLDEFILKFIHSCLRSTEYTNGDLLKFRSTVDLFKSSND